MNNYPIPENFQQYLRGRSESQDHNVDDTGARHNGKNGYCTHIGNEYFAWFETTQSNISSSQI